MIKLFKLISAILNVQKKKINMCVVPLLALRTCIVKKAFESIMCSAYMIYYYNV